MKLLFVLVVLAVNLPIFSHAIVLNKSDLSWLGKLTEHNVLEFNICGSSNILLTKKSISKNFITSANQSGYLFTKMLSYQQYLKLLSENNLIAAKSEIEREFSQTHLWKYTKEKGFEDLGAPIKVDSRFSASIRDCMEGAKTSLGSDCNLFEGDSRRTCCGEKFIGPEVSWGNKGEYRLLYSPDPSVRLKIASEKKHRFCNVQESIRIQ